MTPRTVAVIPARGGSKRMPKKNILPFHGRPMLSYPVQAAVDSGLFDQVIVSSEDEEILDIASAFECRPMLRPAGLARDTSTVAQVCLNVLQHLEKEGQKPDYFCAVYATAVFITPSDLKDSHRLLTRKPFPDVVMGVSGYNVQPMLAMYEAENGFATPRWPDQVTVQSQNHPDFFCSNGTLYWARTNYFLGAKNFYAKKLRPFHMPKSRVVDIDTPEDYEFALKLAPLLLK